MAFNETFRVLFDSSKQNLNKQIAAKLLELDAEAAELRAEKRSPVDELKPKVDALKIAVESARARTVAALDGELEGIREKWEKDRDRHPERELAQIRRAENSFKGLNSAGVKDLAMAYINDQADLSLYELNELRSRLRSAPDLQAEAMSLEDVIIERRGGAPWISDSPEVSELADYRDRLTELRGSQVLYDGDQGQAVFNIDDLIDWNQELETVESGV